jgi:stage V sporulation protein B
MKKLTFVKNAFILPVTSFILRTLGIVLRVYMSNKIGAEGMGLYQMVFSIYILASTFATAGISSAVIKIISEELSMSNKGKVTQIFKKIVIICIFLGLAATFTTYICAEYIGKYLLNDVRTIPALKILTLAFPFMSISSCMKGYFIARRKVSKTSNAQLLEQVIRIALIFFLLDRFIPFGISAACLAVMIGDVISEMCSCLYSYSSYLSDRKKLSYLSTILETPNKKRILVRFFSTALPVAATRYVNTILHTIENLLVPDSLRKFTSSREKSLEQFGMLKGMAIPVMFFPSSFLSAVSTLLIPEMCEANILNQKEKVRKIVARTIHFTITASILIGGLFYIFAYELGSLIYKSIEVGFLIKMLALLVPFMYLESIVTGILQGLNQEISSLKYIVCDSVIRIILVYFLVPLKGLEGFLLIMFISNIATSCLNTHRLLKVTDVKLKWIKWIIKPLFSFFISSSLLFIFIKLMPSSSLIYVITGISIISVLYCVILCLTGAITKNDLFLSR